MGQTGWWHTRLANAPYRFRLRPDMEGALASMMPESTPVLSTRNAAPYKKRAIPLAVRRQVAERYGARRNGPVVYVPCHYGCGRNGGIYWFKYYVTSDLEFDHVVPERVGGPNTADNLVLACRRCNRKRGHRV